MPHNVDNSGKFPFNWDSISSKAGEAAKSFGRKVTGFVGKSKDLASKVSTKTRNIFKKNPEEARAKKLNSNAKKEKTQGKKFLGFTLPGTRLSLTETQKSNLSYAAFMLFPDSVPKTKENQKIWDRIIIMDNWDNRGSSFADQMVEKEQVGDEGEFYYSASQDTRSLTKQFPVEEQREMARLLLLEKAAETGSDLAQIEMGNHYAKLLEPVKAERYFKLASENNTQGALQLGGYYLHFDNTNKAIESYQHAKDLTLSKLDAAIAKFDKAARKAERTLNDNDSETARIHFSDAEAQFKLYEEIADKLMPLLESSSQEELQAQLDERIRYATAMQSRYRKSDERWHNLESKINSYKEML